MNLHWLVLSVQTQSFRWRKIRVTPVPIPNTEVKPDTTDDSCLVTDCENRLLPDLFGILAQLGEHLPYKQEVTGSIPVGPTIKIHAGVAQLVEQLTCNQ